MTSQNINRWTLLALPLALFALGLAACGPSAQPAAPQAPATTDEKPQYGGTMIYGGLSAPPTLDVLANAGPGDGRNSGGVYDKLVDYDYADPNYTVDYKLIPGLAERWEISPDGKTYSFFLRKGVKWHDGEPFTAADVVYTYKRIIDEKFRLYGFLTDVDKVEALDPYTVKLTNRFSSVTFLLGLAASNMGIQPKHVADKGMDLKKIAIGTGPFKLDSYDAKSHTVWVKNPDYWQQGLPYIDRVDLIWSLDKPAMLAGVAIGKVDTTYTLGKVDVETVKKSNPNIQVISFAMAPPTMAINIEKPPFNDVRVRRAIHLAVDRQELIKVNGAGEGYINCFLPGTKTGWCIPGLEQLPGFRQPKDQDLAEAGYPNGIEFNAVYGTAYTASVPLSELFATQMARIGVKVRLDGRDTPTYNDIQAKGTYDTFFSQSAGWPETTDKSNVFNWFGTGGAFNKHGAGNAELDKLIEQQAQTFNIEERKKMWHQMQKIVLDNVWGIPFTDNLQYSIVQPWVKGPMVLNGDSWQSMNAPRMATTWLDQKLLPQR